WDKADIDGSAGQLLGAFGRRAQDGSETCLLRPCKNAPCEGNCVQILDDRDLVCHFFVTWRTSPRQANILRDIELPEHVLIERIVNVYLDPVQPDHALLELLRQFAIYTGAAR